MPLSLYSKLWPGLDFTSVSDIWQLNSVSSYCPYSPVCKRDIHIRPRYHPLARVIFSLSAYLNILSSKELYPVAWKEDQAVTIIGFQTARFDPRKVQVRSEQKDCHFARTDEHTNEKINLMRKSSGNRQEPWDRLRHYRSIGDIDRARPCFALIG